MFVEIDDKLVNTNTIVWVTRKTVIEDTEKVLFYFVNGRTLEKTFNSSKEAEVYLIAKGIIKLGFFKRVLIYLKKTLYKK